MTINEVTHRKKPVEIAAKQFILGTTTKAEMMEFCPVANIGAHTDNDKDIRWFIIPTLEGDMDVRHLDYVIEGVEGEFYPCKPAIFEKTYDTIVPNRQVEIMISNYPKNGCCMWTIVDKETEEPFYCCMTRYAHATMAMKAAREWAESHGYVVVS